MTGMRRRRGLPRILTAALVAVLLVAVLVTVTLAWFLQPHREHPDRVDAVFVIAGAFDGRHELGVRLVEEGVAENFVVSSPPGSVSGDYEEFCAGGSRPEGVRSWCLPPEPSSTAGEAMTFGRLATEQGWETVVAVTNRPHAHRVGASFDACTELDATVVSAEYVNPKWVGYHIAREIGGFAKYWIGRPCTG